MRNNLKCSLRCGNHSLSSSDWKAILCQTMTQVVCNRHHVGPLCFTLTDNSQELCSHSSAYFHSFWESLWSHCFMVTTPFLMLDHLLSHAVSVGWRTWGREKAVNIPDDSWPPTVIFPFHLKQIRNEQNQLFGRTNIKSVGNMNVFSWTVKTFLM